MVKKVMRPPCGSTLGGRPVAPCSALCHRGNPPVVQPLEKAEHFPYLDGFSLDGSARRTPLPLSSGKTRRTESTSTSIPLLPNRTHLSANAFRFGLLAGNFIGFTPPACNTSRNDSQNWVSRSCRRYRQGCSPTSSSRVSFRAISSLATASRSAFIPALHTRRLSRLREDSTSY